MTGVLPNKITIETVREFGPIRIFLDGEPYPNAIEADLEKGLVTRHKINPDGSLFVTSDGFLEEWTDKGIVTAEIIGKENDK